jgi:hypothetical protein
MTPLSARSISMDNTFKKVTASAGFKKEILKDCKIPRVWSLNLLAQYRRKLNVNGEVELNLYFSGWPFASLLGVPIAIDIVFRKVGFN